MKIASGKFAKILKAVCIALTIGLAACYTTSCSFDTNPNRQVSMEKPYYPYKSTLHTNPQEIMLDIDFDEKEPLKIYSLNASKDVDRILMKWQSPVRPNELLTSEHGHVIRLEANSMRYSDSRNDSASYIYIKLSIDKPSTFSFEYKSDIWQDNRLQLFIYKKDSLGNYVKYAGRDIHHKGHDDGWRNFSWELPVGDLQISIELPRNDTFGNPPIQNLVYIDNITIAPNKIEHVDIYPKGLQETYAGGDSIRFHAVPRRADGTEIEGMNVTYSVTGPGSIDSNGIFTPSRSQFGRCTVTAHINGKAYKKNDIQVHQREYLLDPVNIGNYTFRGNENVYNLDTINAERNNPITTDGFIVLEGYANKPLVLRVTKDDHEADSDYYYTDNYIRQGDFKTRIWLRFGNGRHILEVYEPTTILQYYDTGDSRYLGDLKAQSFSMKLKKRVYITNTSRISEKDAMVLMPSQVVQADELIISNAAHNIISELPSRPSKGDVLRSVHDFVIRNLYYDLMSIGNYGDRRKVQDAAHTLDYRMGVCEGYANLYAAICRNLGLKAKVVSGKARTIDGRVEQHAWNHIEYGGKWYMVDATWDDPIPPNVNPEKYNDRTPYGENYSFFMVAPSDGGHPGNPKVESRSIVTPVDDDTITCVVGEGCN